MRTKVRACRKGDKRMKEPMKNGQMNDLDMRTVFAVLRMSRALRRCPPDLGERPFPPAVGRMLHCVQMNPDVSSRELCELLDLRPSSLSEMLSRGEAEGLLIRRLDEEDRRMQHIRLSARGEALMAGMAEAQRADAARKTACFTAEEKEQLAELCEKMSEHLEQLAIDAPMPEHGGYGPRHGRPGLRHGGPSPRPQGPEWGEEGQVGPETQNPEKGGSDYETQEEPRTEGKPKLPPNARIRC